MAEITFPCSECGINLKIDESLLGAAVRCDQCETKQTVKYPLAVPLMTTVTTVVLACPACKGELEASISMMGEKVRCGDCDCPMLVPEVAPSSERLPPGIAPLPPDIPSHADFPESPPSAVDSAPPSASAEMDTAAADAPPVNDGRVISVPDNQLFAMVAVVVVLIGAVICGVIISNRDEPDEVIEEHGELFEAEAEADDDVGDQGEDSTLVE